MDSSWPTVGQAAKELGVSDKTVRRYIKSGRLTAESDKGKLRIDPNSIRTCPSKKLVHLDTPDDKMVPVNREHYEALLIRLGQLEATEKLLIEHKATSEQVALDLAAKNEKIERLEKRNLRQRIFRVGERK